VLIALSSFTTNAQDTAVWNTTTTGTLCGATFTVTGMTGPFFFTADLSVADYSAAPLSATQQTVAYDQNDDWTVTFSEPISNLRVYVVAWRSTTDGTFDSTPTILSGSNFTVTGNDLEVSVNFGNGIVDFSGDISSLSFNYTNASGATDAVLLTFTGSCAAADGVIPTLGRWGLMILGFLFVILGIVAIGQEWYVKA
jgi:hypothetical protein